MSKVLPTRAVPLNQLDALIFRLLAEAPRTIPELLDLTGYSASAVRRRLNNLKALKRAHHRNARISTGMQFTWHPGPEPKWTARRPDFIAKLTPAVTVNVAIPRQPTYRTYPDVGRRDTLVAALFGPAGARP